MDYALYFKDGTNRLVKKNKIDTVKRALVLNTNFYVEGSYITPSSVARFEPIKREEPKPIELEAGDYKDASNSFFGLIWTATLSYYKETGNWVFTEGIRHYAEQFGMTTTEIIKNIEDVVRAVGEQQKEWKEQYNIYMMASDTPIKLESWVKRGIKHRTMKEEKKLWAKLNDVIIEI